MIIGRWNVPFENFFPFSEVSIRNTFRGCIPTDKNEDEFIPAEGNFFGSIQQLYQYRNLLAESGNPTFFDWVSQDIPSSKMLENGSWTFKKPLQSKNSSFKKCRSECLTSPEFIPEPKYRSAPLRDSQPCVLRIFRRAQVADSENPWNTLPC